MTKVVDIQATWNTGASRTRTSVLMLSPPFSPSILEPGLKKRSLIRIVSACALFFRKYVTHPFHSRNFFRILHYCFFIYGTLKSGGIFYGIFPVFNFRPFVKRLQRHFKVVIRIPLYFFYFYVLFINVLLFSLSSNILKLLNVQVQGSFALP